MYLKLFWSFFQIGLFSFGGGYAATFVGIRIGGNQGAIVATIGCVLPSCVIVLSFAYIYYK